MNSNDLWPALWQKLYDHGASERKREGAERYWRTLSSEQQEAVYYNISRKLASGGWVQYDPIRAIKENVRQAKELQPEFLKGDEGGDLVQVRYQGFYKICTRATMELFGLEWVRDW